MYAVCRITVRRQPNMSTKGKPKVAWASAPCHTPPLSLSPPPPEAPCPWGLPDSHGNGGLRGLLGGGGGKRGDGERTYPSQRPQGLPGPLRGGRGHVLLRSLIECRCRGYSKKIVMTARTTIRVKSRSAQSHKHPKRQTPREKQKTTTSRKTTFCTEL